jgi:hypothetical protein
MEKKMESSKKLFEKIENLSPYEAKSILRVLCDHEDIAKEINDLATATLKNVDADDIAEKIYSDLNCLDEDELFARSGRTRYGYVEPFDVAHEMMEDAVAPYLQKQEEYAKMKMWKEEKIYAIGIIKGLLKYNEEGSSYFLEWSPDSMTELAQYYIYEWQKTKSIEEVAEIQAVYDSYFE